MGSRAPQKNPVTYLEWEEGDSFREDEPNEYAVDPETSYEYEIQGNIDDSDDPYWYLFVHPPDSLQSEATYKRLDKDELKRIAQELSRAQIAGDHDQPELVSQETADAVARINAHRRRIGQSPLDPAAQGWTPKDVLVEEARVARLHNDHGHLLP